MASMARRLSACLWAAALCATSLTSSRAEEQADEPNPPNWPDSVRVFSQTDTDIQET
eukprot:SAG22_NODE_801_length_7103_cov_18.044832_6_plen_57_part_00